LPTPEPGFEVGHYRLDFAYVAARLSIELEGREYHSGKKALMRDVARRNYLSGLGWSILYFTWDDVTKAPGDVLEVVRGRLFPKLVS
jgi:very-short-patch-repair endonuclease